MNAHNDLLKNRVASLAPIRDEDLEPLTHGPAARALFEEIVSIPRSQRARLASRVGRARGGPVRVGVAAAAVILLVFGLVVGSQMARPTEAIAFSVEGDHIVARIADPEATKQELEDAFAERGLDVRVFLVPASPSIVGTIGAMWAEGDVQGGDVEIVHEEGACFTQGGGFQCPVGLKIVNDFDGRLTVEIGRPAAPGETYSTATEAFAPGEVLHCSGVRGKTVREALPVLADRGVRVIWRTLGKRDDVRGIDPATIADHYLVDALGRTQGEVWIWVSSERPNLNPKVTAMLDRGC